MKILLTNEKEIVLFETEDKNVSFPVQVENETVWLSANQMASLFERDEKTIRKHINNVFSEGEVDKENNTQKMRVVGVTQLVPFYSLFCTLSRRIIVFMMGISELLRLCFYTSWIKMMLYFMKDKNVLRMQQ